MQLHAYRRIRWDMEPAKEPAKEHKFRYIFYPWYAYYT